MSTFYIHFNTETLDISSISANSSPSPGFYTVPINDADGLDLIRGEKNLSSFCIAAFTDNTYKCVLKTIGTVLHPSDRLNQGLVYQINAGGEKREIHLVVNKKEDLVEIHFNGDEAKKETFSTKLYFTKADDMSFLVCSFSLDRNVLNKIKQDSGKKKWINPILLKIDTDDLSVFGIRNQSPVSLEIK